MSDLTITINMEVSFHRRTAGGEEWVVFGRGAIRKKDNEKARENIVGKFGGVYLNIKLERRGL